MSSPFSCPPNLDIPKIMALSNKSKSDSFVYQRLDFQLVRDAQLQSCSPIILGYLIWYIYLIKMYKNSKNNRLK